MTLEVIVGQANNLPNRNDLAGGSFLIYGENPALNVIETVPGASDYQEWSGATGDVVLGAVGAAGDFLGEIRVRAASVGGTVTTVIKDGTIPLDSFTTTAQADNTTVTIVVNRKSKQGGWRINQTVSAGTIANVKNNAAGKFR